MNFKIIGELLKGESQDPTKNLLGIIPYREYRADKRLFIMSDQSLGVIYRLGTVEHEPLTVDELEELRRQFEKVLDLPSTCTVQFLAIQHQMNAEEITRRLKLEQDPECEVANMLRVGRVEMELENAAKPFERSCYLAIRYFPKANIFSPLDLLPESLADSIGRGLREFDRRVSDFEQILSRIENLSFATFSRIDAEDFRHIVRFVFGAPKDSALASINPEVPLQDQLLFESVEAKAEGLCGKLHSRTVSFLVPASHFPGAPVKFLELEFPYLLSLRMTFPTKAAIGRFLAIKEWCTKNSFSANSQRQYAELQLTKKRLAEGDPCVHLAWSMTVYGGSEKEAIDRANRIAAVVVEQFDCNTIMEKEIGFDLLRGSLPLQFEPKSEWGTQRHIPLHRSEVASFLPIFDSFRGTKIPLQLYRSRENNLVPFSMVEGETCQHGIFLGDSGSGKSAFLNSVINGLKSLNPEPLLFVVESNTSQAMNVRYYGGEMNVFSPDKPCKASVFRGIYDEKKVTVLTNWICEAIRLTSPTFVVESEHREAVSQAIRLAVRKCAVAAGLRFAEGDLIEFEVDASITLNMDLIATELSYLPGKEGFERFKEPIEQLLVKMRNFYGDGLYASYFAPSESSAYTKRFYVYDLAAIQDDPVLLNLTVASIFEEIRQVKLLPENQNREIWAVLDEIAVLGRESRLLTQYFINRAETGRKDAFWIYGATNRPQNFVEIPVCLALMQVAEHLCFLPMNSDNVKLLTKMSERLTVADAENISSLEMKKGEFTEIYYVGKSTGAKGIIRYMQTPHERWQSPTNAKDGREALKALQKFGGNAAEAIQYLVKNFPKGVA